VASQPAGALIKMQADLLAQPRRQTSALPRLTGRPPADEG
jgi:hypothetical protein